MDKQVCGWKGKSIDMDGWMNRRTNLNWQLLDCGTGNPGDQTWRPTHPQSDPCRLEKLRGSAHCPPPAALSSAGAKTGNPRWSIHLRVRQSSGPPSPARVPVTHRGMPQDPVSLCSVWCPGHLTLNVSPGKTQQVPELPSKARLVFSDLPAFCSKVSPGGNTLVFSFPYTGSKKQKQKLNVKQ